MNRDLLTTGAQGPVTMSSREIAHLCEKQHKHVLRDIEVMIEQIVTVKEGAGDTEPKFGLSDFEGTYTDSTGRSLKEYRLPKDLTVTLITGYRADLRYKVVKRLEELESRAQTFDPSKILESPAAMRGLLLAYTEKVIALEAKVEGMQHDVAAHERLTKADGSLNVTEAAKNLGLRPKDLFDWLSHNGWIYRRANSATWLGFQTKCNQGLMEHKTTTVLRADGSEKITEQVRITAKGLSVLAKLIHPTVRLVG
jgi:phage antirepressor YoqD-like protein/phage regulator Rha-like protein